MLCVCLQTRHAFEIHLENSSVVELCNEEDDIPHMFFSVSAMGIAPGDMPSFKPANCSARQPCQAFALRYLFMVQ